MNLNIFQSWSLKTRVTALTLAIFMSGALLLALYGRGILQETVQRQLGEQQFSTVSVLAADIDDELDIRLRALAVVSQEISLAMPGNPAGMQTVLEKQLILQQLFNGGTFILRQDGTVVSDFPRETGRIGINYMDRDYSIAALKEGKPMIGQPVTGRKLGAPIIGMSTPIRDTQGKVIGALVGVTNLGLTSFLDKFTEDRYGKANTYLLATLSGHLIVTATDKTRVMRPLPDPSLKDMAERFAPDTGGWSVLVDPAGKEVLTSVKGIPLAGWYVIGELSSEDAMAPFLAQRKHMLLVTSLFALLAGALMWWMLRRQLSPMLTAIKTLTALSSSDQTPQPLAITRHDEVGELIGSFNRLLETLVQRESLLRVEVLKRLDAQRVAESASRAKSEFLSSMSHELRTPMNAILGFSQIMELDDSLDKEHRDSVREILKAGQHLLNLINEVLDLAKIESGRFDLSLEPVGLNRMIHECLLLLTPLADKRAIHLHHDVSNEVFVHADRTRIKQVLLNLLSNAVKYNREGGSVHVSVMPQGPQRLRLLVRDTGMGISAERLQELFQPFNRLGVENSAIEGAGIGLTISRRLVEAMGGTMDVQSEPGVGSTFWIELPREPERIAPPQQTATDASILDAIIRA